MGYDDEDVAVLRSSCSSSSSTATPSALPVAAATAGPPQIKTHRFTTYRDTGVTHAMVAYSVNNYINNIIITASYLYLCIFYTLSRITLANSNSTISTHISHAYAFWCCCCWFSSSTLVLRSCSSSTTLASLVTLHRFVNIYLIIILSANGDSQEFNCFIIIISVVIIGLWQRKNLD